MLLDNDAFSSGQIGSKIWLAEELETVVKNYQAQGLFVQPLRIVLLGGWYATTNFILQCRKNLVIETVRSIDIDQTACDNADLLNEFWVWQNWTFKAKCADANSYQYNDCDVVINTSSEHIESLEWFNNIPVGTLIAIQSNNMPHDDHVQIHNTIAEFDRTYDLKNTAYIGEKEFVYPDWAFKRFMKIGVK